MFFPVVFSDSNLSKCLLENVHSATDPINSKVGFTIRTLVRIRV
jgi:hypothetical protein